MIRQNLAAFSVIGLVSGIAIVFLFWLIYFMNPIQVTSTNLVKTLPYLNAFLNSCIICFVKPLLFRPMIFKPDKYALFPITDP